MAPFDAFELIEEGKVLAEESGRGKRTRAVKAFESAGAFRLTLLNAGAPARAWPANIDPEPVAGQ